MDLGIITQTVNDLVGKQWACQKQAEPFDQETANAVVVTSLAAVFKDAGYITPVETPVEEMILTALNTARKNCGIEELKL